MRSRNAHIPTASSTVRVAFLIDVLTALLITFAAALVLIQASVRYGVWTDQLNTLILSID